MKLAPESSLALNDLKGGLVTNPKGGQFRIYDFYVDLVFDDISEVWVCLIPIGADDILLKTEAQGLSLKNLKDWSIQLNRGFSMDTTETNLNDVNVNLSDIAKILKNK